MLYIWYETDTGDTYAHHGTIWSKVNSAGGGGSSGSLPDLLMETKTPGTLVTRKTEYQSVSGAATQTILNYAGEGYVSSLFLAVIYSDKNSFYNGLINVYVDGESTPSVSVTLAQFFMAVYQADLAAHCFNNKFFGCNADASSQISVFSALPIPFATSLKIDIVNGSSSAMTLFSVASLQSGVPNTWPRTRRLRVSANLWNGPTANTTQTVVNVVPGVPGRLVGLWMLSDDVPNSLSPYAAEWEGNFRFYLDAATKVWAATTAYSLGDKIIDTNGNLQTVSLAGTSSGSAPVWSQAAGGTTSDGSAIWTQTPGTPNQVWKATKPFALNMAIVDPNGNVQRVTTAGTTAGGAPTWNTLPGGTTTDGSVTWTNQGSAYQAASYQSSGTEDYFQMGFYMASIPINWTNNGYIGSTFINRTGGPATLSAYRFHINDPIVFSSSLAITWQVGDTSQVSWSSGSPKVWVTAFYYTE
jgi:hypothetical protein